MTLGFFIPFIPQAVRIKQPKQALSYEKITPFVWDYPTDPLFPKQSNLLNSGQHNGIPGEDINASNTIFKEGLTGKGVVVVVHDDGILTSHKDLKKSLNSDFFFNPLDKSKNISYGAFHGTGCAGIIASEWNNGLCGAGIAPGVTLGGTKTLNENFSVNSVVDSLMFKSENVSVHSSAFEISGCKSGVCQALPQDREFYNLIHDLTTKSRNGKGTVFVFAAGNDAQSCGDTNLNTLSNWRDNIIVAASTNRGKHAYYSTVSSSVSINAPSSYDFTQIGVGQKWPQYVKTTSNEGDEVCNEKFSGTSASTPLVAGIVALLLEANSNLTSRDVSMILALSATKNDPKHPSWVKNGAGLYYSPFFGFGRVNVDRAVELARKWENLDNEVYAHLKSKRILKVPETCHGEVDLFFNVNHSLFIETGELSFNIESEHYSMLRIVVESPSGTQAVVKQVLPLQETKEKTRRYITMRNFLGENIGGQWKIRFINCRCAEIGTITNITLSLYGTKREYTSRCKQTIGVAPYDYEMPTKGNVVTLKSPTIKVYDEVKMELNQLQGCNMDVFIEDQARSTRLYFGSISNLTVKTFRIPFDYPIVPDGFTGNLVLDSFQCNWTTKTKVTIKNDALTKNAIAGWLDKKGGGIRIEWKTTDHLPTESPSDFVLITANEGTGKKERMWKVINRGYVEINESFTNESTLFTISATNCDKTNDTNCFIYQITKIGNRIDHSIKRPKLYPFYIVIIITLVGIVISVIAVLIIRRFYAKRSNIKAYEINQDLLNSASVDVF